MYTHAMGSRERLLEAMCELMWRNGYSAISPREVRELSGVGQGSMYHYFPTKRDLGLAALWRNCRAHADAVTAVLDSADELLDAVTAYIAMTRQTLKGCRAGRMVQDRAVMTDDEFCAPVAQTFDETHRRLTAVIEAAIAAGAARGAGRDVVAEMVGRAEESAAQEESGAQVAVPSHTTTHRSCLIPAILQK